MRRTRRGSGLVSGDPGLASTRVVLVDENEREIESIDKVQAHRAPVSLHRGFSLYLFRGDQKTLVTQRAFGKTTWPGVWTNACCGHPQLGETAANAAVRHLAYELGMRLEAEPVTLLPNFRYSTDMGNGWGEREVCPVLGARVADGVEPTAHPDEVSDHQWMPWDTFVDIASLGLTSPWSRWQVEQMLAAGTGPKDVPNLVT